MPVRLINRDFPLTDRDNRLRRAHFASTRVMGLGPCRAAAGLVPSWPAPALWPGSLHGTARPRRERSGQARRGAGRRPRGMPWLGNRLPMPRHGLAASFRLASAEGEAHERHLTPPACRKASEIRCSALARRGIDPRERQQAIGNGGGHNRTDALVGMGLAHRGLVHPTDGLPRRDGRSDGPGGWDRPHPCSQPCTTPRSWPIVCCPSTALFLIHVGSRFLHMP